MLARDFKADKLSRQHNKMPRGNLQTIWTLYSLQPLFWSSQISHNASPHLVTERALCDEPKRQLELVRGWGMYIVIYYITFL